MRHIFATILFATLGLASARAVWAAACASPSNTGYSVSPGRGVAVSKMACTYDPAKCLAGFKNTCEAYQAGIDQNQCDAVRAQYQPKCAAGDTQACDEVQKACMNQCQYTRSKCATDPSYCAFVKQACAEQHWCTEGTHVYQDGDAEGQDGICGTCWKVDYDDEGNRVEVGRPDRCLADEAVLPGQKYCYDTYSECQLMPLSDGQCPGDNQGPFDTLETCRQARAASNHDDPNKCGGRYTWRRDADASASANLTWYTCCGSDADSGYILNPWPEMIESGGKYACVGTYWGDVCVKRLQEKCGNWQPTHQGAGSVSLNGVYFMKGECGRC
ncbi:hypothetical protein IJJ12_01910 [bacterium]|nr:hypothetical protein [bacterium]